MRWTGDGSQVSALVNPKALLGIAAFPSSPSQSYLFHISYESLPALHPSANHRPVLANKRQSVSGPLLTYTCVDVEQVLLPVADGEVAGSRLRPLQFICEFDAPGRRHDGVGGPMPQPKRW